MREGTQPVDMANQVAGGIPGISVKQRSRPAPHAPCRPLSLAQLFDDDAAFLVYLPAVERDAVRPVMQYQQAGIHNRFTYQRHVGNTVTGIFPRREGVQVVPEFHAYPFEPLHHPLAGKIRRPVESHVFEEMGESLLRILLLYSPDIVYYPEFGLSFGLSVVPDIIGHAVLEHPLAELRVIGQFLRLHYRRYGEQRGQR